MTKSEAFDVTRLPELLGADPDRIELAKLRQAAVWRGETPEPCPICFNAPLTSEQEAIPDANYREAFYDADRMLCSQVRGACRAANARSDAVPSIRANMGTGTLAACMGLEQLIFEDKMPWLQERLTRGQVAELSADDIRVQGTFERGLDHMRRFRQVMGDSLAVYCMDTQGPFDLAHLILGDDLFYALSDDPPLVHHLMEVCLELGIRAHTWMKEINGEPLGAHCHGSRLYAENMGIRICEDTTALLGPDAMREFALPYARRLARHFGGAWVHYCGRNDHLTEAVLEIPEIRGINFGHVPGHQHDHPFERDMQRCLDAGKVYAGYWPRREGETGPDYLKRLHEWSALGCLITVGDAAVGADGGFDSVEEALDFWYSL